MTFDSKMMICAVSQLIAKSDTLEEAYSAIQKMGNVEGVFIEPYEEARKNSNKKTQENKNNKAES